MGQITIPSAPGITVNPTDRESGPGAGPGATGNNSIFLGLNAGKNSAVSQLIVIGNNSGDAGITDVADLSGSTIVGAHSAQALTTGSGVGLPITLLGSSNAQDLVNGDSTVIVGSSILSLYAGTGGTAALSESVFIGNKLLNQATGIASATTTTVMIGYNIMAGVTGFGGSQSNVLIGSNILGNAGNNNSVSNSVMIGNNVGAGITGTAANNILIGAGASTVAQGANNICIGSNATQTGGVSTDQYNICIGQTAVSTGVLNVVIGTNARTSALAAAQCGSVSIGANAGASIPATANNILVIESSTTIGGGGGNAPSALMYGIFGTGNVILGTSVQGTNRDMGGTTTTNILKLLNGTVGNANPVGGGYFYVSGGLLFWVDSSGTQSQLSESVQGQLASSSLNAFSNNAAAAVGTLTNAPVAGNPTKWIPINDAGTIRNVPAW